MAHKRKRKHHLKLVLQLTSEQVVLAILGPQVFQTCPEVVSQLKHTLGRHARQGSLTAYTGAKLHSLGGGWYHIYGYHYKIVHNMHDRFKVDMRVDEQATLNMMGIAA